MNTERVTILLVGSLNAGAGVLAASTVVPPEYRVGCAALVAACGFALGVLLNWERDPAPHG